MKKKSKYFYITIISIIVILIGTTLALLTWYSATAQRTNVNVTIDGLSINYNGGTNLTGQDLKPTPTKEGGISKVLTIGLSQNEEQPVCANFYLTATTFPSVLKHSSFKYAFYNGITLVQDGNFASTNQGDIINLNQAPLSVTTTTTTYTLYIWIDATVENPSTMFEQNHPFVFTISADGSFDC